MDPRSEVEIRDIIKRKQLQVVGWYHSHPVFHAEPSIKDIENQLNYQILFRDEKQYEPFVGLIFGPYDVRLPSEETMIKYFYVDHQQSAQAIRRKPMSIESQMMRESDFGEVMITLSDLVELYKDFPTRTNFSEIWRYCSPQVLAEHQLLNQKENEQKVHIAPELIDPCTKMVKLQRALQCHLPESLRTDIEKQKAFLDDLCNSISEKFVIQSN